MQEECIGTLLSFLSISLLRTFSAMPEYTRHKAENIEFMGMSSVGRCLLGVARGSLHVPGLIPSKTFFRYQNQVGWGVFEMLCDSWCLATSLFELVFVYAVFFFWNDGATQQKKPNLQTFSSVFAFAADNVLQISETPQFGGQTLTYVALAREAAVGGKFYSAPRTQQS